MKATPGVAKRENLLHGKSPGSLRTCNRGGGDHTEAQIGLTCSSPLVPSRPSFLARMDANRFGKIAIACFVLLVDELSDPWDDLEGIH